MPKKVTFNGIELSLPKYDKNVLSIFDYLDMVIAKLESGLDKSDGNFQLSINLDFATDKPPKHKILDKGTITKKSKDKVLKILRKVAKEKYEHTTGSVKVNVVVDEK